jgi:hypothetical protein
MYRSAAGGDATSKTIRFRSRFVPESDSSPIYKLPHRIVIYKKKTVTNGFGKRTTTPSSVGLFAEAVSKSVFISQLFRVTNKKLLILTLKDLLKHVKCV